jgi:hypothetical protein
VTGDQPQEPRPGPTVGVVLAVIAERKAATRLQVLEMQMALQCEGLGTGWHADGQWTQRWRDLYETWLAANPGQTRDA